MGIPKCQWLSGRLLVALVVATSHAFDNRLGTYTRFHVGTLAPRPFPPIILPSRRSHSRWECPIPTTRAAATVSSDGEELPRAETAPRSNVPSQTVLSATFGLMKAILGSGCLALPFGLAAMSDHPYSLVPANILLLLLGGLSAYTFSLYGRLAHATRAKSLGEIWKKVYESTSSADHNHSQRKDTSWIVSVSNFIYCLGCCLTFSLVIGDSLSGILRGAGMVGFWPTRQACILGTTATVLLPLVQLPSLAALAPVSILGVLGTMVIAAFMTLQCPAIVPNSPYAQVVGSLGRHTHSGMLPTVPLPPQFGTYHRLRSPAPLVLVAMACVAWMAHFSAPDFYHSFVPETDGEVGRTNAPHQDRHVRALRQYNLTTVLGYGLVAIVNAIILSTGFLTFGGNSMGMILNNYSPLDRGASLSRVLVLISMLGGYPFVFQGCLSSALDLMRPQRSEKANDEPVRRRRMTYLLQSVVTTSALVVRDAGFVVSFNGALMGTAIIYIFPSLLFLRLTSSNASKPSFGRRLALERGFAKFLIVFGGVSSILGAVTAVLNSYFPHLLR